MRAEPKRLAMVCLSFRLDALTEPATHSTGSAGQARCSETVAGSARHRRVTSASPGPIPGHPALAPSSGRTAFGRLPPQDAE